MASTCAAKRSPAMKKFPNWLEMPHELMVNILQRLRTVEIFKTRKVCTTWRLICKDPALWKVVDVYKLIDGRDADYGVETLTKQAVLLSCGELTDISISGFGTDDLLDYVVLRASKLNSLCLEDCNDVTMGGLTRAVKRVPQLEKLHLGNTSINAKDIEVIGRNCPQLKSFKVCKWAMGTSSNSDDRALAIANNMHGLRYLELIDRDMTNNGLEAILNGCPHLETLDVRMCCSLSLDGQLGQVCMTKIKDFKCDSPEYEWYDIQLCDCCGPDSSPDDVGHSSPRYNDFENDFDNFNDSFYW